PSRAGEPGWSEASIHSVLTDGPRLGPSLVDEIEDGVPQYLTGHVNRWLDEGGEPLPAESARAAVEAVEPQQVIESVLSCEWEAWLDPRWWRGHTHITARIDEATAGAFASEVTSKYPFSESRSDGEIGMSYP